MKIGKYNVSLIKKLPDDPFGGNKKAVIKMGTRKFEVLRQGVQTGRSGRQFGSRLWAFNGRGLLNPAEQQQFDAFMEKVTSSVKLSHSQFHEVIGALVCAGRQDLVTEVMAGRGGGRPPNMSSADWARIQQINREITQLSMEGDDYYVRQDQRKLREEKSRILERNRTPEQKEVLRRSQQKHSEKRWVERQAKEEKEKQRKAGLTEREKAINQLCDLKRRIAVMVSEGLPTNTAWVGKELQKIRKQFDQIRKQYGIKSYEIKRQ